MTTELSITCRDPIVSRDGRPFGTGQGNRMRTAGWLSPSVVAGSLRSAIAKVARRDFSTETTLELLQLEVAGVFPVAYGKLYLPAPRDCECHETRGPLPALPETIDKGGCDWPVAGLRPVLLADDLRPDSKPIEVPEWWPLDRYAAWLTHREFGFDDRFLCAPETEHRTHVQLDPHTGVAEEGNLFTTVALSLTHLPRYNARPDGSQSERFAAITLAARVRAKGWCDEIISTLDSLHPLGGERRLAHWRATTEGRVWDCPFELHESLSSASKVRMVLATPAVFDGGWKPAWLNESLIGTPPGAHVTLKLVGVCIDRWRAVSGWSLASLRNQPLGPKPVRRVVPAGGVYFFETVGGSASNLADRWLEPVSDAQQDRRDGFGLAVWGIW